MPRGFKPIESFGKRSSGGAGPLRLRLKEGETANVRFLEQGEDIFYYYYHDFSHLDKTNGWKYSFPDLDQEDEGVPSPGRELDFPRKFKTLVNVIWRDAPLYERDSDGRIVVDSDGKWKQIGNEDQVAVWEGGVNIFKTLAEKDAKWEGISSRDAEIKRTGTGRDTRYAIEPADINVGPVPPSEEDKELAKKRYNLENVAGLDKSYDEIKDYINKHLPGEEEETSDAAEFIDSNPFEQD